MLDLRHVVDHLEEVRVALGRRGAQHTVALDEIAQLRTRRSAAITARDAKIHGQKAANEAMAKAPKGGPDFTAKREELKALSTEIKALEADAAQIEQKLEELLLGVPNLPDPSTPDGFTEADNRQVRAWGEKPTGVGGAPKDHVDLGVALGIVDFDRAAKISGARFALMVGLGARLERAIAALMLDLHTRDHGYTELLPPVLVRTESLRGTGQLPKFEGDLFKTLKNDPDRAYDLYLSPTSEVQLTNLHADEILDEARLPIKYTAHTSCFRSEAGSYGKDTRGLIRNHQFQKVELVQLTTPETSDAALEELTGHAERVLQVLGLHYRVVQLCAGDLGFGSRKTYDLEVWLPGQSAYREISSCSNMGDFQARRARIRSKKGGEGSGNKDKPRLVHTLNGSGLAVGRTLVAILEQYQRPDGSVVVPEALRPVMGVDVLAPKK
ncbi:MAG: serine--tRNA ligase [Polyangiales bacterium]